MAIDLPSRPDPGIEVAAYFAIGEAMTNAIRHAGTDAVAITGTRVDGRLVVEVADAGRGNARAVPGGGLEGLGPASRRRAVGSRSTRRPGGAPG